MSIWMGFKGKLSANRDIIAQLNGRGNTLFKKYIHIARLYTWGISASCLQKSFGSDIHFQSWGHLPFIPSCNMKTKLLQQKLWIKFHSLSVELDYLSGITWVQFYMQYRVPQWNASYRHYKSVWVMENKLQAAAVWNLWLLFFLLLSLQT